MNMETATIACETPKESPQGVSVYNNGVLVYNPVNRPNSNIDQHDQEPGKAK